MIPEKRKPGAQPGHSQNENQSRAAKENFALFLLKGMETAIFHLSKIDYLTPFLPRFRGEINYLIQQIKAAQSERQVSSKRRRKS